MNRTSATEATSFTLSFIDHAAALRFAKRLLALADPGQIRSLNEQVSLHETNNADSGDAALASAQSSSTCIDFWLPTGGNSGAPSSPRIGPFSLLVSGAPAVSITGPIHAAEQTSLIWLQVATPSKGQELGLDVLALPAVTEGLSWTALHGLAGLAHSTGGFEQATWAGNATLRWAAKGAPGSRALRSVGNRAVWTALPIADSQVENVFCAGLASETGNGAPSRAWCTTLHDLATRLPECAGDLQAHLGEHLRLGFDWRIEFASGPPADAQFVTKLPPPAEDVESAEGIAGWLVPNAVSNSVIVGISSDLSAEERAVTVLHLFGHLALGHVTPEDQTGHWDTSTSIKTPARHWDRDAAAFVATRLTPRAESLADCSDTERATLMLLDLIRRQLGQTNALHQVTACYYAADYQRAAAQRLVHQLDRFGGGMLCDGVGLGKTYVATTVLIHYTNMWRERHGAGDSRTVDPFRISILAPNSVVATWENEAIAPLETYGVPREWVRVIAHSKLSRILGTSELLTEHENGCCDMEHLLLSDLVIVDEAHNFRTLGAKRTLVLRDTLRNRHRFSHEEHRRVLLLTATPVNNSLDDLRQQASLMLSPPVDLSNASTAQEYRDAAVAAVQSRIRQARALKGNADRSALLAYGAIDKKPEGVQLRNDLEFGPNVPRIHDYLRDEASRLLSRQANMRDAMLNNQPAAIDGAKIAGEFLDRIVVQRSRHLCKEMEQASNPDAALLFRPDAGQPQQLKYDDVLDAQSNVLSDFLPLFQGSEEGTSEVQHPPLSLKIYMWSDVRDGVRSSEETTPVVGLQRVLVLKRLESSPVSFLITMLRLLALHARRVTELASLCRALGDTERLNTLQSEIKAIFDEIDDAKEDKLDVLLTNAVERAENEELLQRWSEAHRESKSEAASDDIEAEQLDLLEGAVPNPADLAPLERLWELRSALLQDLKTLLLRTPALVDIVFPNLGSDDLPKHFIRGGEAVAWPKTAMWGKRVVSDGKLRTLFARLLTATRNGERVIVFSQFTDSVAYISSVLRALDHLDEADWANVLAKLQRTDQVVSGKDDLLALRAAVGVVCGETENREQIVDSFAPFYRISPIKPEVSKAESPTLLDVGTQWEQRWRRAIEHPVTVLFASDVLAEGVNLQDASLLINFDIHWNPVRMIQRAGRIDRRLNPKIENASNFPDLEAVAKELGQAPPSYWWHDNRHKYPVIANMLPPDDLEKQLMLRERIATKTMTIDFTLGLEQGTGAEADWMESYRYEGINALNAWQGDRAIERLSGYAQRIEQRFRARGIDPAWVSDVCGWLVERNAPRDGLILASAKASKNASDVIEYSRRLQPVMRAGAPHWLWTTTQPSLSTLNYWIGIDDNTWPPPTRQDIGFAEESSTPIYPESLLIAAARIVDDGCEFVARDETLAFTGVVQGFPAIAAGFFHALEDQEGLEIFDHRILQFAARATDADNSKVLP